MQPENDMDKQASEPNSADANYRAEMEANYPDFRKFVYAKLREDFERTVPPLTTDDLEQVIKDEDGQPLESFIDELEQIAKG